MLVKICGNTRPEDIMMEEALGVHMVGIVGVKGSPRYVDPSRAELLARHARRPVYVVDHEVGRIVELSRRFWMVQVHRVMSRSELMELRAHGVRVIAYVPMSSEGLEYIALVREAGHMPLIHSANGRLDVRALRAFGDISDSGVAGGIDVNNAHLLIGSGAMFMDVSRGSEVAPGVKDPAKVRFLVGVAGVA